MWYGPVWLQGVIDTNFMGSDVLAQTRPDDADTGLASLGATRILGHVRNHLTR